MGKKQQIITIAATAAMLAGCAQNENNTMELTQEWDKVFPKSELVNHSKVTFTTQYGFILAADLYAPKTSEGQLPAIAVSGPFGAVKEQSSGLYAQTMAERGYVTLAFDPSFTGESSGEPRRTASPDINTEDFMSAVDYLSTLDCVDPDRIFLMGESQGAYVSALAASIMPEKINGLILWYPAFILEDNARIELVLNTTGITEIFGMEVGIKYSQDAAYISIYNEIGKYKKKVQIIHGDSDDIVPLSYSEKALSVYNDADLYVIPNGKHGFEGQQRMLAAGKSIEYVKSMCGDN